MKPLHLSLALSPCLLLGLFAASQLMEAEAERVSLLLLRDGRVQTVDVPGNSAQAAYEQMLKQGGSVNPLAALWQGARRYIALRNSFFHVDQGNLSTARAELERLVAAAPVDLLAKWRLIELLSAQGDHAAVLQVANDLLSRKAAFAPALLMRARVREAKGDILGSLVDFSSALEHPMGKRDFHHAASGAIQLMVDLNHPEEAMRLAAQLEGVLSAAPETAAALGHAAHALGDDQAAVEWFRRAHKATSSAETGLAFARSLDAIGRTQEALDLLLARRFNGELAAERWMLLSRLADKLKVSDLASNAAEEAVALATEPSFRLEVAQRLLDSDGSSEAAERALLILSAKGNKPCSWEPRPAGDRCYLLAAEAMFRSTRHDEAVDLVREAMASSGDLDRLGRLAVLLLAAKRDAEAASVFTGLATASTDPAEGAQFSIQAAEARFQAGNPEQSLAQLDAIPAGFRSTRAIEIESAAAHRAKDWRRLRRLIEAQPLAADGLPLEDETARAYCQALAKLQAPELRTCVEALADRHPDDAGLHYHAADLARRAKDAPAAAESLKQAIKLRNVPQWHLELGFLLLDLGRNAEAESSIRRAEAGGAGPEASLALAYLLLDRGRSGPAAHLLRRALKNNGLSDEDRLAALETLARILSDAAAHASAATALSEAVRIKDTPDLKLRQARALQRAGDILAAQATISEIDRRRLSQEETALYFDLAGSLARDREQPDAEVEARRSALAIRPSATRHELLASALLRRRDAGDQEEARAHLWRAIALDGEDPHLLARLAYLDKSAGDLNRAERLLTKAMLEAPRVVQYRQDLAHLMAESGREEEALVHLRAALNAAQEHPQADATHQRERVQEMQAQHRRLSRRWRARLEETLCLGRESACQRASLSAAGSQVGQGLAEVGFQPFKHQTLEKLELTARLNWDRAATSALPRTRFAQAAAGLRVQPLRERDLWFGLERTQALGSGGRDDWRVYGAYRQSSGLKWHSGDHELAPFASGYGELGHYLGGDRETIGMVDLQAGLRGQWGRDFAYLPFFYLNGTREQAQGLSLLRLDSGLGLTGAWRLGKHRYDGFLADGALSLRVGYERDSLGKSGTRAILSYSLRY